MFETSKKELDQLEPDICKSCGEEIKTDRDKYKFKTFETEQV